MPDENDSMPLPSALQAAVNTAPTYFVDGILGTSTGYGIARMTFGSFVLNITPNSDTPFLRPAVTLVISELQLLAFAEEILERAELLGIKSE